MRVCDNTVSTQQIKKNGCGKEKANSNDMIIDCNKKNFNSDTPYTPSKFEKNKNKK